MRLKPDIKTLIFYSIFFAISVVILLPMIMAVEAWFNEIFYDFLLRPEAHLTREESAIRIATEKLLYYSFFSLISLSFIRNFMVLSLYSTWQDENITYLRAFLSHLKRLPHFCLVVFFIRTLPIIIITATFIFAINLFGLIGIILSLLIFLFSTNYFYKAAYTSALCMVEKSSIRQGLKRSFEFGKTKPYYNFMGLSILFKFLTVIFIIVLFNIKNIDASFYSTLLIALNGTINFRLYINSFNAIVKEEQEQESNKILETFA